MHFLAKNAGQTSNYLEKKREQKSLQTVWGLNTLFAMSLPEITIKEQNNSDKK